MAYDNIKSHKNAGIHPLSEKCIFGKTIGGIKLASQPFQGKVCLST